MSDEELISLDDLTNIVSDLKSLEDREFDLQSILNAVVAAVKRTDFADDYLAILNLALCRALEGSNEGETVKDYRVPIAIVYRLNVEHYKLILGEGTLLGADVATIITVENSLEYAFAQKLFVNANLNKDMLTREFVGKYSRLGEEEVTAYTLEFTQYVQKNIK